jgi:hypothetical protein
MDVTRGAIFTAGRCSLAMDEQNKPRVKYTGNLSIRDLATLDKAQAHDFLKWKQLNFQSLAAGYNPLFVTIREISLVDFLQKSSSIPSAAPTSRHFRRVKKGGGPGR